MPVASLKANENKIEKAATNTTKPTASAIIKKKNATANATKSTEIISKKLRKTGPNDPRLKKEAPDSEKSAVVNKSASSKTSSKSSKKVTSKAKEVCLPGTSTEVENTKKSAVPNKATSLKKDSTTTKKPSSKAKEKKMPLSALNDLRNSKKTKSNLSRRNSTNDGGPFSRIQSQTRGRTKNPPEVHQKRSLSTTGMDGFFTPQNLKTTQNYEVIVPKCKLNSPLRMRRVRRGEVALSFQGSPLLVNPVLGTSEATLNIPLEEGSMLSLQAHEGMSFSDIPAMDPGTLKQLNILNTHINKLLKNNF